MLLTESYRSVAGRNVKEMGKKGSSWITALKKAFTSNPKEKSTNVSATRNSQTSKSMITFTKKAKKFV